MNQPKFKFGDKLKSTRTQQIFTVDHIKEFGDGFYYWEGGDYGFTREENLGIYQEPKKKKLYAWSCPAIDEIVFTREDKKPAMLNLEYLRLPEYDIEYPSEEVK
jgi:hypothetical protein